MNLLRMMLTVWLAVFVSQTVTAQVVPSQAQLEIFQSMPADQQRNLAKQFGIDLPRDGEIGREPQPTTESQNQMFPRRNAESLFERPVTPIDRRFSELRPYGYDLFASSPTTFAPVGAIPAPESYVIGPGDRIRILFFGKESADFISTVDRDGTLAVQDIGRINAQGLQFDTLRELISTRVRERKIGVDVSVTLDELRSIQVFILGDVALPGSFTVSSLSTVTNALFVAGGITERGSLRRIELKRGGQTIAELDLYDLLMAGDVTGDLRVRQGDVIFVPDVGSQVAVSGEVNRPAIFEVQPGESLSDVLRFASGFSGFAYTRDVRLNRTIDGVRRISRSLNDQELASIGPQSGDAIEVLAVAERPETSVELRGLVSRPGYLEWWDGMTIRDAFQARSDISVPVEEALIVIENPVRSVAGDVQIVRGRDLFGGQADASKLADGDRISVVPLTQTDDDRRAYYISKRQQILASAKDAENAEGSSNQQVRGQRNDNLDRIDGADTEGERAVQDQNSNDAFLRLITEQTGIASTGDQSSDDPLVLAREDRGLNRVNLLSQGLIEPVDLSVPFVDRQQFFDGLVSRLEAISTFGQPPAVVMVRGEVRDPGVYPLPRSRSIVDLLVLAGGLKSEADLGAIELVQRSANGFEVSRLSPDQIEQVDMVNAGSEIIIRKDQDQIQLPAVTVAGFVKFPGTYRMPRGSSLADLIERAGGVTSQGDLRAAIFSRKTLREKERAQLGRLRADTESQLAQQALRGAALNQGGGADAVRAGLELSRLLREVEDTTAIGRLVVDLPKVLAGQLEQDVILEDGDALVIPGIRQSVTVLGEVLYPTSHIYEIGVAPEQYIASSGGFNRRADAGRAYIIRANGAVQPMTEGNFLTRSFNSDQVVEPGDTIVIPRDVDDVPALQLWTAVTQIVYQSAIAISAIGGIDF